MNGLVETRLPSGVTTVTGPLPAPEGTVAEIWVDERMPNCAGVPLKRTEVVDVSPVPRRITLVPGDPVDGATLLSEGG